MKGKLCASKGTLIQIFITFDNGNGLNIHPLFYDAAVIAFGSKSNIYLKNTDVPDGHIVIYDHSAKKVADFAVEGSIVDISNTVLYTNGKVWSGSILEDSSTKDVTYIVLTEEALSQLKDPGDVNFKASHPELAPTIIVSLNANSIPTCSEKGGEHRCTACWFRGKLILDGLGKSANW